MLRFNNPIAVPQRYTYQMPDGSRLSASHAGDLYALCQTRGEKRPYKEWYELMIHHMCLELPPSACAGDTEGDKYVKSMTWADIRGFITALLAVVKTLAHGEPVYVSQPEADRRSFICSTCRYNWTGHCAGCMGIIALAQVFLRSRFSKHQGEIGACKLCGCWLAAKVWCTKEVLRRIVKKDFEYPEHCWNKEVEDNE
jgi:hypothetical protein